jgi:hypothetical protein
MSPIRLGALQDALLDAGASPAKAERAAEELADYERRLATLDTKLAVLTAMVGTVIGLVLLVLGKVW